MVDRPIVATDVAGHSEIVEDGVSGLLVDAPTDRALGKAVGAPTRSQNDRRNFRKEYSGYRTS
jgi:hypothetical protein